MSIEQMRAVWKFSRQKGSPLLLLLAIADNANEDGIAWPGIKYLAEKTRMSERQVMRTIPALEAANELAVVYRRGRGSSNLYHVLCNKTEDEKTAIWQRVRQMNAVTKGDNLSGLQEKGDSLSGLNGRKGDNLSQKHDNLSGNGDKKNGKGDKFSRKGDMVPEKTGHNLLTYNNNPQKEPSMNPMSFDFSSIWGQALAELRLQMAKATYDTWFIDSRLVAIDEDTAVIQVTSQNGADWINNRLAGVVSATLTAVAGQELKAYARPPLMR